MSQSIPSNSATTNFKRKNEEGREQRLVATYKGIGSALPLTSLTMVREERGGGNAVRFRTIPFCRRSNCPRSQLSAASLIFQRFRAALTTFVMLTLARGIAEIRSSKGALSEIGGRPVAIVTHAARTLPARRWRLSRPHQSLGFDAVARSMRVFKSMKDAEPALEQIGVEWRAAAGFRSLTDRARRSPREVMLLAA
jgi:hypothetical protein